MKEDLAELSSQIVAAYVRKNSVQSSELPDLIQSVHDALARAAAGEDVEPEEKLTPAVPVSKSIRPDYIICLEDGMKFKSLKRHLRTKYGLSPDEYREKWDLPSTYPMVAPNYAAARSELAKKMGLGRKAQEAKGKGGGARKKAA